MPQVLEQSMLLLNAGTRTFTKYLLKLSLVRVPKFFLSFGQHIRFSSILHTFFGKLWSAKTFRTSVRISNLFFVGNLACDLVCAICSAKYRLLVFTRLRANWVTLNSVIYICNICSIFAKMKKHKKDKKEKKATQQLLLLAQLAKKERKYWQQQSKKKTEEVTKKRARESINFRRQGRKI